MSCPKANDVPIASPSPKLCSPIPIATSGGERDAAEDAVGVGREPARDERHREEARRHPEQYEAWPAERSRQRSLQLERLEQRLDAEKREQTRGQGHERRQPVLFDPAQRRQPEQAEADRQHADEEADDRVTEKAAAADPRRLDRGRDLFDRLDPGGARHPHGNRVVGCPVVGNDDRARAQPAESLRPVDRKRDDRIVDGDGGDRQVVLLRIRHPDADLARLELDPANVELVRLRRDSSRSGRASEDPDAT